MNEDKAARYHRLRRRARVGGAIWTAALLAALLFSGAAHALRSWTVTLTADLAAPLASMAASALFAATLWALHQVVALPISHYLGLTLERRYGLSRQRFSRWLADQARGAALSLFVSMVSVVVVYEMMRQWPAGWWLAVWVAGLGASVCLAWLAPVVLVPLFVTSTPLADDSLRRRLVDLSSRAGAPVPGIYQWRLSDRTRRGMAALTGLGSTRRVVVSDTLVADYAPDEIEVVLAHELAHHVHKDAWKGLALDGAILGVALGAAGLVLPAAARPLNLQGVSDLAGLPLLLLVGLGCSTLALPIANALSRAHERRADAFALDLTRKPEAFVSAMRRLATQNLAEESPPAFARWFFATHPPFDERLARARAWKDARGEDVKDRRQKTED